MPKGRGAAPVLGRAQGDRPQATPETPRQAEGPRTLQGALSLPIEQIIPDPNQPRKGRDQGRLEELAASIAEHGVLHPLLVREYGFLDDGRTRYMIVAGERRYLAAQLTGLSRLPAVVRDTEGAILRVMQLIENLQREDLNPIDEAHAFKELMELEGTSTREVAARIHRSHSYIADRLVLIQRDDVANAVATGRVQPAVAIAVAREDDPDERRELLKRVEREKLGKGDVQRIRRERKAAAVAALPRTAEPTLREVARDLGASEAQVREAAFARRESPDLTPAEALTLAMSAPPDTAPGRSTVDCGDGHGQGAAATGAAAPRIPPMDPLREEACPLFAAAVAPLLEWAMRRDLDVKALHALAKDIQGTSS